MTFGPAHDGLAYVKSTGGEYLDYFHVVVDESDGIIAASNDDHSPSEQPATDSRVVLTRFVDGIVDSTFSPGGVRELPRLGTTNEVRGLVLQEQRVMVLLLSRVAGQLHPVLVRLWR